MKSLRDRLTAGMLVTVAVVFVLQWLLVTASINTVIEGYVLSRLAHDGDSLLAAASVNANTGLDLPDARLAMIYERPFSGHYFRVSAGDKVHRSRSLWDQDIDVADLSPGERRVLRQAGPQAQPLLVLARGFEKQGARITVAVAEDLGPVQSDLRQFKLQYLLVSAAALLVLVGLQRAGVRWGLRPLQSVEMSLQALRQGRAQRLAADVPEEVKPLAQEVNRLLDTLARRLSLSRNAVSNLAHGLKTPLTLLVKLADQADVQALPAVRSQLSRHTDDIQSRIDRELRRAQIAGSDAVGNQFHPADDLADLASVMRRMHGDKTVTIQLQGAATTALPLDRQDMLELLGNIMDNACKWARSSVQVTLACGEALMVEVHDDGPGCSIEDCERLGQRGLRLDESTAGHGMGLAIARDIVELYGGSMALDASPLRGGLRVLVRIPLPATRDATPARA